MRLPNGLWQVARPPGLGAATIHSRFAVPPEQWEELHRDKEAGMPVAAIMAKYGISRNCIFSTLRRRNGSTHDPYEEASLTV